MPALSTFNYNVLSVLAAQLGLKPVWSLASGDAASDVDDWLAYALSDYVQSSQLVALRQQVKTSIGSNVTPDAKRMFEYYRAILDTAPHIIGTRTSVPEEFLDQAPVYGVFSTIMRDDFANIRVVYSHWYGNGVSPGVGKNLTVNVEAEATPGVYTPVTFGGATVKTTAPLTNIMSDPIPVSGPRGTVVKFRGLYTGCCNLHRGPDSTLGEGNVFPATGLTLTTARAAAFNANFTYAPSAIIGTTSSGTKSVLILGDSRPSGLGDSYTRADGSYGNAGGALNAYPWAQMVQWGGKASDYLAGAGALQAELAAYATDIVSQLAANDLFALATAASIITSQASIRALYPSKRFHLCTVEPKSSSTDSFATLANQTTDACNAQLQLYNAAVLANSMGYDTPLNFATVGESSVGSGKWRVDGTANKYVLDGIHQSPFCYGLYPGAGFTL
jgi:hypothetical protein